MNEALPTGWIRTPIGEVTTRAKQRQPLPQEHFDYIDIASIDRDTKQIRDPKHLSGVDAPSRARQVVAAGDVLVSMTRPNLNAVAMVTAEFDGQIASTGFDVLRPIEIDRRWLFYLVRSEEFVTSMSELVQGALYPAVRPKDVRGFEIPLAPLSEQKRIADKLDALLARVDACRARLDGVALILKRFRQAVLAAATSGRLTEEWREEHPGQTDGKSLACNLQAAHEAAGGYKTGNAALPTEDVHDLFADMFPEGWQVLELRALVRPDRPITYGILKPGPDLETGVPYIRVADFPDDRLNVSTIRRTSVEIDKEFSRSKLEVGDILLSIRGTVGRLIVVPQELDGANITQDSARLSLQQVINRNYVLWYLRSDMAQKRMKRAERGVAVRGINIGDVRALQIPIPSFEEQTEIVRRVEALFAYTSRLEARYRAARGQIERLTSSLLGKAFRGELVPQDPADKPAAVLLDRIRATRAAQPGKPKSVFTPRTPEMSKMTVDSVRDTIRQLTVDTFSFEELRKRFPGDYDSLKDIVFALLDESDPSITQAFDQDAKAMRFVRRRT